MSSPETLSTFAAGIRAIATSPAFGAAAAQTVMLDNHHWMLLLYRLADGDMVAGLGYVADAYPGMLDAACCANTLARWWRWTLHLKGRSSARPWALMVG